MSLWSSSSIIFRKTVCSDEKDVEELQRDKHAIIQIYNGEPEAFIIIVS
jgi:hypothetical protein